MRPTLLTTVAAAALSLGLTTAMAQSGSSPSNPAGAASPSISGAGGAASGAAGSGPAASPRGPAGGAASAPGPGRGDAAASSRPDTAPGQERRETATGAPGRSGATPGQEQAGAASDRARSGSEAAGERQRAATGAGSDQQPAADRDRQRAEQERGDRNRQAGSERDRQRNQAVSERERDRQQAGSERDADRRQAGSDRERDRQQADTQRGDRGQQAVSGERDQNRRAGATAETEEGRTARQSRTDERQDTAQSRGSASGALASASISQEKRTEIRQNLVRRDIEPVRNVNFSISVGVSIPERVRLYEVPASVAEVVPQYRGYRYTIVEDEIVIVDPRTRRIVEVIDRDLGPSRSTTASVSRGSASLSLSREQRTTVSRTLKSDAATAIRVGGTVPSCVELTAVPQQLIVDVPELRSYRYFAIGEEIAIVEPDSRRIIEIIE